VAAVELAEPALRLGTGRMSATLVDELARLAVLKRPDRRAVDHEVSVVGRTT
jgi:hypothetical protein